MLQFHDAHDYHDVHDYDDCHHDRGHGIGNQYGDVHVCGGKFLHFVADAQHDNPIHRLYKMSL